MEIFLILQRKLLLLPFSPPPHLPLLSIAPPPIPHTLPSEKNSNDLDVPEALVDALDLPREQGRRVGDRDRPRRLALGGELEVEARLEREEEVDESLLDLDRGGLGRGGGGGGGGGGRGSRSCCCCCCFCAAAAFFVLILLLLLPLPSAANEACEPQKPAPPPVPRPLLRGRHREVGELRRGTHVGDIAVELEERADVLEELRGDGFEVGAESGRTRGVERKTKTSVCNCRRLFLFSAKKKKNAPSTRTETKHSPALSSR